jgi:membrane fusion protein (multidrug efflux system)
MDQAARLRPSWHNLSLGHTSWRKLSKWLLALALLLAAGLFGWRYWQHSRLFESTDDAYLNAHTVEVSAQVSGPVVAVHVRDNAQVAAGAPLFDIDPAPFQLALARAQAQLQLARQAVAEQGAAVATAQAQVEQRAAELRNAQSADARNRKLVAQRFLSPQTGEASRTQVQTATAALKAAQASLEQATSALGQGGERNASVQAAEVAVRQAQLDLDRTQVRAPGSGTVANFSLRPGDSVQAGVPVFSIISDQEYWADANFKETQLARIHPGQAADIYVDMYPDHPFHGVVESISGGAGTAFSLLPPQNATGNWVKVTQRVPVRVRFANPERAYPLRIGTTATVEVRVAGAAARR